MRWRYTFPHFSPPKATGGRGIHLLGFGGLSTRRRPGKTRNEPCKGRRQQNQKTRKIGSDNPAWTGRNPVEPGRTRWIWEFIFSVVYRVLPGGCAAVGRLGVTPILSVRSFNPLETLRIKRQVSVIHPSVAVRADACCLVDGISLMVD